MTTIYTSSFVHSDELTPENMLQQFEDHADKLVEVAENYRKLAAYMRDKKIKIVDAQGLPHGGSFKVDEIDTGRLKSDGFVVDFADDPKVQEPIFYIDTELDRVLEEEFHFEKENDEHHTARLFGTDYEDEELDPDFEVEISDAPFPERTSTFNLKEIFSKSGDDFINDEDEILIGAIEIGIKHIDEDKFSFHIVVPDLGPELKFVKFDREKCTFRYKCEDCDSWHYESLDSTFRSLRTVNALLSNLVGMTQETRELSAALEFVDRDLRLLQNLIKSDYAIDDTLKHPDDEMMNQMKK